MKGLSTIVAIISILLLSTTSLLAKNGLSVGFGAGYNTDAGNLNGLIQERGIPNNGDGGGGGPTIPNGPGLLVMSETALNNNVTNNYSNHGDYAISESVDLNADLRFTFLKYFFIQTGFNYDFHFGVHQEFEYTGGPNANVSQEWKYGFWQIPSFIGINIPIHRDKGNIYFGAGAGYYNAFWEIKLDTDDSYFLDNTLVTYSPVHDSLRFESDGVSAVYLIGADAEVWNNLFVYLEYRVTDIPQEAISVEKEPGDDLYEAMNYKKISVPTNFSKSVFIFGVKYHVDLGFLFY